ncbi:MAG: hybrid sensor histidine kinase/response regulator [Planctomycetota bacterium]|jgi:CheY-like chemotaxis protein
MTATTRHTILVVDDQSENIAVLVSLLGPHYRVLAARNGEQALSIARDGDNQPDLILLDVSMPGIDGFETCRRLKAVTTTADIPVIFITVHDNAHDEALGFEVGAVDYIAKPIIPSVVLARVQTHLTLRDAQAELLMQNDLLRENTRLREDVDRMTHHDLKSPLTIITASPRLVRENPNLTEREHKLLARIEQAGYNMLGLINRSIDLYKMETGTYKLNPATIDIMHLIEQIHAELEPLAASRAIIVSCRLRGQAPTADDRFTLLGEDSLYYSMLSNLIKNAIEAAPPGSTVETRLDYRPDPSIEVHNLGVVPEPLRTRFFEKYVTVGKLGGTGIGTYAARLCAVTLGGDLTMSTDPDLGTALTFTLVSAQQQQTTQRWVRKQRDQAAEPDASA